jgi:predicted metal-dependent hydrolase
MPFRSRSAAVEAPEQRRIALDHPHLPEVVVRVRRNKGGRNVRIHVDEHGEITASVPLRFAARRIDPIVRERAEWLHEVLERTRRASNDTLVDLDRGDPTRWLGVWLPTSVVRGASRRSDVRLLGQGETARIEIRVPADEDPHDVLLGWYRREARRIFESRTEAWAQSFGLDYGKVSIREQRTRWGSCTHKGDLSFNWRLVLAPAWVLDSIVVHELCHIDELNHSDRFWALLDERYPRHHEASEWLKEHGSALRITKPDGTDTAVGTPGTSAIGEPNWPGVGEEDDLSAPVPDPTVSAPKDEPTDEQFQMSLW